ncbi:hypothetical protein MRX96_011428 [Rhipicephalus microplus]
MSLVDLKSRIGVRLFGSCKRIQVESNELGRVGSTDTPRVRPTCVRNDGNLRPGQTSSWKYYNVMDSLLKQQTRAEDFAGGRGDDSENSSGAENSAAQVSTAMMSTLCQRCRRPSCGSTGTAIMQPLGASASAELNNTAVADTVLVKKEVETDESAL